MMKRTIHSDADAEQSAFWVFGFTGAWTGGNMADVWRQLEQQAGESRLVKELPAGLMGR